MLKNALKKIYLLALIPTLLVGNPLKLNNYLNDFNKIEGWFEKPIVNILIKIDQFQNKNNISGNVGEIGVYHGKSFIPLCLLTKNNEIALAVDCFDDQQFNYDLSGMGCQYAKFINNLKKYTQNNIDNVRIMRCDSSKMTSNEYLAKSNNNKFRIFSIDGCHRSLETQIDLKNTTDMLQHGGIIIIDDYFNKDWPAVSEGVARFLISNDHIKPFFVGWNKMLLTHKEFVPNYINLLKTNFKPKKSANLFESEVLIFE